VSIKPLTSAWVRSSSTTWVMVAADV
jgi:hypothetical protein